MERPLELDGTALVEFAAELRRLRAKAGGPSYRELARRAHYSSTTLSDAAAGRRMPSLEVTLAYVRACQGDAELWEQRWHRLTAELHATVTNEHRPPERDDERAPYVGLSSYSVEDADRFFGREQLVDDLIGRISERRFLAVFGPSGSGKSSLLRAGLVPRLTADRCGPVVLLSPGSRPVEECAIHLARLSGHASGSAYQEIMKDPQALHRLVRQALIEVAADVDIVLVIDQFEEVFTLCRKPSERSAFISALITATQQDNSRCRVVLGVRADFYVHCSGHTELVDVLQDSQVTVGPMKADELRRAIAHPAINAGCTIESSLLTTLIAESHGRPGVLPLLSHALLQTWRRRRGNLLSLAGFQAIGGIDGALTKTADAVFESFSPGQKSIAKDLFLRLTALGEGTEDTKRRVSADEVDDNPDTATVLEQFTSARLLVRTEHSIEITHEALIRSWPRLREWLAQDREGQRLHRELTEATATWQKHHHDPSALLRGTRLALIADWIWASNAPLNSTERAFLDESIAEDDRQLATTRRRARHQRNLVVLLTVLLMLSTAVAVRATYAERAAERQRNMILAPKAAAEAIRLSEDVFHVGKPEAPLAAQIALTAYRLDPSQSTRHALTVTTAQRNRLWVPADATVAWTTAFDLSGLRYSTSHTHVAIADRANDISYVHVQRGRMRGGAAASLSPGGWTAATVDKNATVRLWSISMWKEPDELSVLPTQATAATFSRDGRLLVTTDRAADASRMWDISNPRQPRELSTFPGAQVDFEETNQYLVSIDQRSIIRWDITDRERPQKLAETTYPGAKLSASSLLPGGQFLVAGDVRGNVSIIDLTKPGEQQSITLGSHLADAKVASSRDGKLVATAGVDGKVTIWDTTNPRESKQFTLFSVGQTNVIAVTFASDGRSVVATGHHQQHGTTLWRWFLHAEDAAKVVCFNSGAGAISPEEWRRVFMDLTYRPPCQSSDEMR